MEIEKNLCSNALRKVALLITKAADLEMDLGGFGEAAENKHNGNVYLWLEDYTFSLYIPLYKDEIMACWSNPYVSEEEIINIDGMALYEIEKWASDLWEEAESKFN